MDERSRVGKGGVRDDNGVASYLLDADHEQQNKLMPGKYSCMLHVAVSASL